jgi:hypothetical protein
MVPQEAAGDCVVIPASALNMDSLRREVAFLRRHMAIIRFTTTLLPETCHTDWIRELEDKVGGRLQLHKEAGNGFFYLQFENPEFLQHAVGLTPCMLSMGAALIHT